MLIQHFQEEQLCKGEKEEGLLGHSSSSLGLQPGGLASAITGQELADEHTHNFSTLNFWP